MNAHEIIADVLRRKTKVDNIWWVACGGSLIDLMPANSLLQREGTTLSSHACTAREFTIMIPKKLGAHSLVIACSHSGNTPEVVGACRLARETGAYVIALTDAKGSKIDTGEWPVWVYPWGEGVPAAEVPAGISLWLAAELLDQQERYADFGNMTSGIAAMDEIIRSARVRVRNGLADRFASMCRDHEFLYIVGSGPNFSQTYGFAICSLMEMQWQNCCYIHSGEYFHGPLEVTEPGVFYFLQMGSSEFRTMDERARGFLKTHTDSLIVLDALEYGMKAIPESVRAYLDPVLFYAMNCEMRSARGRLFKHDPDVRRYMGVESY
ncbi:sugar isomerase (SIS) [Coriobacterium glomerans PW2]|uniref:Sugar isomerase (SIS) n=1 Tax=Coriobacterium glomerans (strain ATCC 49209 / DSM 20642 / JCM 10262 / PW2) TaxID=700015 RepID=F2N7K4_CORGP|nr:SIS domain-containing protein [Coriobacterium glomerans]AEB06820.1 sugar isomerase (SIS) [Coriobacterium glomerans PW2]